MGLTAVSISERYVLTVSHKCLIVEECQRCPVATWGRKELPYQEVRDSGLTHHTFQSQWLLVPRLVDPGRVALWHVLPILLLILRRITPCNLVLLVYFNDIINFFLLLSIRRLDSCICSIFTTTEFLRKVRLVPI